MGAPRPIQLRVLRVDSVVACQIASASQLSMGEAGPFRDANALRAAIDSEHGVGVLSRQQSRLLPPCSLTLSYRDTPKMAIRSAVAVCHIALTIQLEGLRRRFIPYRCGRFVY